MPFVPRPLTIRLKLAPLPLSPPRFAFRSVAGLAGNGASRVVSH
jgi:hypothetical protein